MFQRIIVLKWNIRMGIRIIFIRIHIRIIKNSHVSNMFEFEYSKNLIFKCIGIRIHKNRTFRIYSNLITRKSLAFETAQIFENFAKGTSIIQPPFLGKGQYQQVHRLRREVECVAHLTNGSVNAVLHPCPLFS